MQKRKNQRIKINFKLNMKKLRNRFEKNIIIRQSTQEFLEGVVARISLYKKSAVPVIDLDKLKENVLKKNKSNKVVQTIYLEDENEVDGVHLISKGEFKKNLSNEDYNLFNIQDDSTLKNCLICFRNIINTNTRMLNCGHEFCEKCTRRWLNIKQTCPICRKLIN